MVVLEALKCAQCGKQCDRALFDGYLHAMSFCTDCDKLLCGNCRQSQLSCPQHSYSMIECQQLSSICIFAIYAPEAELSLMNLQTALNVNCSKCNSRCSSLYRFGIQQVLCDKCCAPRQCWMTSSMSEKLFRKIICELTERAMPETRVQRGGVLGTLPMKIIANCKCCKKDISACSRRPILLDGEPYCYYCGEKVYQYFPVSQRCYCLSHLIDFIQCIPENQLQLLTYSKWLKAANCTKHQDMLSELNAVSADGTRTSRKLCSFFKTEHVEKLPIPKSVPIVSKPIKSSESVISAQAAVDYKKKLSTLRSKLELSTPDRMLPDRITCSCGREEELPNLFDCFTCSTYGVCGACLAKKHWGHEIKESMKTMALCLIDSQSGVTRQKLSTWTGHVKELSQQGEQSFEKMCHAVAFLYKNAMNCEDLQGIQSLLARANTSEIEKNFKNAMNSTRTLYKSMDSFCVGLLNAVEETENAKSTMKGMGENCDQDNEGQLQTTLDPTKYEPQENEHTKRLLVLFGNNVSTQDKLTGRRVIQKH